MKAKVSAVVLIGSFCGGAGLSCVEETAIVPVSETHTRVAEIIGEGPGLEGEPT